VTNIGPGTAENVVVTDSLPSRTTLASVSGACTIPSAGTVRCTAASLASGGTASFTIVTTLTGKGNGWITNSATVASATPDPVTSNNAATARVRP
jgi:hypothetical protein